MILDRGSVSMGDLMASRIRALDSANRTMQRLGFLKVIAGLVNETETTNMETLGKRFISRVTQRVKLSPPYDNDIKEYARTRLTDRSYKELRKRILEDAGPSGVEFQDAYLADKSLPSSTGKLVQANWRMYPYLATSLENVKRNLFRPNAKPCTVGSHIQGGTLAFGNLNKRNNPLRISEPQATVLLYCLLDNDAEVAMPLLRALVQCGERFDERAAGDMLPDILRQVVAGYAKRSLPAKERDRLSMLGKFATPAPNGKARHIRGAARGKRRSVFDGTLLRPWSVRKPNRDKFEYEPTDSARALIAITRGPRISTRFYKTAFSRPLLHAAESRLGQRTTKRPSRL